MPDETKQSISDIKSADRKSQQLPWLGADVNFTGRPDLSVD
jgi:hypothetical protein